MTAEGEGQREEGEGRGRRAEGGGQRAECDLIIRVGGVKRAWSGVEQRVVIPEVESEEGRGQKAKWGRNHR